jgi:tetraacyldisaccharide 4'-kinase
MREPRFWSVEIDPRSREAAPLTKFLLTPFAWLYAYLTAHRIQHTIPTRVKSKVLCVGNLTAGGVGKSPIVAHLRALISQRSEKRVATLSRGYKGRLKGPIRVDFATHTASDVGDEPLMLSASGESWIGADRAEAGEAMALEGIDVIIMDDGHQNPTLHKDFSFVVVDSTARFGNGHIIPKGPLREPIEDGLKRADAVIFMGATERPPELQGYDGLVLFAHIEPTKTPPPHDYVAFAGIGRPEKMFDSLIATGANVKDSVPFPDHHAYTKDDLRFLRQLASDNGARLITTEKDYARLKAEDREDILTFPVEVRFDDPDLLETLIKTALETPST